MAASTGAGVGRSKPPGTPAETDPPRRPGAAWGLALALGAVALVATLLANQLLVRRFADAPQPDDLLFQLLPYLWPARWLTVVALVGGFGAFVLGTLRRAPHRLPAVGAVFALMYLLRAGIMVLTPLAPPHGDAPFITSPPQFGMFPSGHVAALTLLALLTPRALRGLRAFQWGMVVLVSAGLLLAHGHYSIDVVGGFLLAWFVAHAWRSAPLLAPFARVVGR